MVRGYSTIIALTVFTVAAFALVLALDSCFDAADYRNQLDVAMRGLSNQMVLLHGARISAGENDAPGRRHRRGLSHVSVTQECELRDQKAGLPILNMYRATITASWKDHAISKSAMSLELIFQP